MSGEQTDTRLSDGQVLRSLSVSLPERQPDEDPATQKQIGYLRKLAPGIAIPNDLGKWQASALIDRIKEEKERLDDDIASGRIPRPLYQRGAFWGWMIVLAVILFAFGMMA